MQEGVYFHNLDKIRFFAAFSIFLGHGCQAWSGYFLPNQSESTSLILNRIIENAPLGVELFFFISGFLITYILLKEKELTGKIAIGKFFIRRAIRIWPLYFLLIALTPVLIGWLQFSQPPYLPNLLFWGNFDIIKSHGAAYPFAHFWSIAIEEQFYLIWPFIIAFIPRKRLVLVFILLILASLSYRYSTLGSEATYFRLYYHTFSRMDTLVIGALFALIFIKGNVHFYLKPWMVISCVLCFVGLVVFSSSNVWASTLSILFKKYLYLIPLVPLTLHFISRQGKTENRVGNVLSYLGKSSYGLYMIHNIVTLVVVHKIMLNNGLHSGWVFWSIYTGITFVLVIISFELYEKPLLRLKRYFTIVKTRKY